jgi:large subunit ribosomal protein L4
MAKAKLHAENGELKAEIELPAEIFEAEVSEACIYLAVNAYLANQRQGTSKSKTRSEINGSGAKPWKQKGTGRARSGTNSSPIWVRGNKAHGPEPRDYTKKLNKKVRRRALLSALTAKASSDCVRVFEGLSFEQPKTKALLTRCEAAGLEQRNALFVVGAEDKNVLVAARNIPWARVMRVSDVNTYQIVRARNVVFSQGALEALTGAAK